MARRQTPIRRWSCQGGHTWGTGVSTGGLSTRTKPSAHVMTDDLTLAHRSGLPDALRVLVEMYPRTGWQTHANFNGMVQFWLERHLMFRRLLAALETDVQAVLDRNMSFDHYAPRLSRYGGMLLNELHSHHHIEDSHYFPQLVELDTQVTRGFDLLDADHHAMDGLLIGMGEAANAVLQGAEVGVFARRLDAFAGLLNRHLVDEEEIVVPVILSTGFDG